MLRGISLYLGLAIALIFIMNSPVAGKGGTTFKVTVLKNVLKLDPEEITIRPGDTVKWTNIDDRKHNLASLPGSGTSDALEIFTVMEPGAVYTHKFDAPGEYPYFCFIHNQMTGHITVAKK